MMTYRVALLMAAASWPAMAAAQDAPVTQDRPATAPATGAVAAEASTSDEPDIIVSGQRNLPGAVIGDIKPELQLGPADIRSYGVSSIADLLTELGPQTRSGAGGAPVVLLDGKRISGFQEIRDIPTEAIARVDILPEEVALKYGYTADQRVVNFVLRRRFRATTVEAADRIATAGGTNSPDLELGLLTIQSGKRLNINTEYNQQSALTEAERDILPQATETGATNFDQRPFRTLLPETRTASANIVYARPIGDVSATLNGQVETSDSVGRFGLPSAAFTIPAGNPFATATTPTAVTRVLDGGDFGALSQRNSSITSHLGTNFNGRLGEWQWTLTGAYDRIDSETFTETGVDATAFQARLNAGDRTANPAGPFTAGDFAAAAGTQAYSTSSTGQVTALANGSLFSLPAGDVSTSIRVGGTTSDFDSRSVRLGVTQRGMVSRDIVNGRVNIDLPIASRSKGVLGAIGDLSINANLAADHLSDFGTLNTYGYGATWTPVSGIRVIGSVSDTDEAPSATQLGAPTVLTPNARVFDYVNGVTATVARTTGGNPLLVEDNRRLEKLGLTIKPWSEKDLTLTANYTGVHVDDPIAAFPTPTAAIEAAFPDRFTRDAAGNLLRIDARPINYARTERTELRWGINFSMPLKSKIQKQIEAFRAGTGPNPFAGLRGPGANGQPPAGGQGAPGAAPGAAPGGGGGGRLGGGFGGGSGGGGFRGGPGGGGFGGRGGAGGGRLQFAVYHTWHFTDRVLVADNGPRLDLLNGDAIGASGGSPRHELEGQAGYSNNGIGTRLSVNWQSATRVNGGSATSPETLNFSGLATANLRLFADLGQRLEWVKAHPWLRGMRITAGIENVFDSRQRVTDATGSTPISYQPDYLNPLGRTVRVSIRKLFF